MKTPKATETDWAKNWVTETGRSRDATFLAQHIDYESVLVPAGKTFVAANDGKLWAFSVSS